MVPYIPEPDIAGSSLGHVSEGVDPLGLAGDPSGSCLSSVMSEITGVLNMYLKNSYVDQQIAVEGIW